MLGDARHQKNPLAMWKLAMLHYQWVHHVQYIIYNIYSWLLTLGGLALIYFFFPCLPFVVCRMLFRYHWLPWFQCSMDPAVGSKTFEIWLHMLSPFPLPGLNGPAGTVPSVSWQKKQSCHTWSWGFTWIRLHPLLETWVSLRSWNRPFNQECQKRITQWFKVQIWDFGHLKKNCSKTSEHLHALVPLVPLVGLLWDLDENWDISLSNLPQKR